MGTTLLQIQVDDTLKQQAATVFENFGGDTTSAVRSFLQQAVTANSVSFTMTLPQTPYKAEKGRKALLEMNEIAERNGLSDMSLDEINAEIAAARRERAAMPNDVK